MLSEASEIWLFCCLQRMGIDTSCTTYVLDDVLHLAKIKGGWHGLWRQAILVGAQGPTIAIMGVLYNALVLTFQRKADEHCE